MNREELKALILQLLEERNALPGSAAPEAPQPVEEEADILPDITKEPLRTQYFVPAPHNGPAFLALKEKTPARLGLGRAGARYKTASLLRFRADHAAARDSVLSQVPEDFAGQLGLLPLQTRCRDKEEYLTRPDLGRRFDEAEQEKIRSACRDARVLLVIGDGLSAAAITANAPDCAAAIRQGLEGYGIRLGQGLFVRYCRVGASDHIGELTGCEVVCMLVGERPGLVTSRSMSAYLTYQPRLGTPESSRTVLSNIHAQGISPVEAGAHIAALIDRMLREKASGVALAHRLRT